MKRHRNGFLVLDRNENRKLLVHSILTLLFPEFRNETEYTEWSECTKTCGMGIQSRASKNGEQTQSRFCNTEQCPGMFLYVICSKRCCSDIRPIRGDPSWISRKNCLELIELSGTKS